MFCRKLTTSLQRTEWDKAGHPISLEEATFNDNVMNQR